MKTYRGACNGYDLGLFQAIRFSDDGPGYQCVDRDGNLLGLIFSNGRYDDPHTAGNISWDLCEETEGHRRLLRQNAAEWNSAPIKFTEVK